MSPARAYRSGAVLAYILVVATFLTLYLRGYIYSLESAIDPYNISIYAGVVAYVVFMTQFLLSARIVWLERLLGQDLLLRAHGFLGIAVFGAIAVHGVIKFAYIGPSPQSALGVAAALIYIVLTPAAIFILQGRTAARASAQGTSPRYERAKIRHNILVIAALLAVAHVQLASSTYSLLLRVVTLAWAGLSLGAYVNHKYIRPRRARRYRVTAVEKRPGDIVAITMEPADGKGVLRHRPGQFAYFRFFSDAVGPEEHPFTIASPPSEPLRILVRQSGDFTRDLAAITSGDEVAVEGPYGRFSADTTTDRPLVLVAGGIGVTPMMSIVLDEDTRAHRATSLVWSVRSSDDIAAAPELAHTHGAVTRHDHVTGDGGGRLDRDEIGALIESTGEAHADWMVCGPPGFIDTVTSALRSHGVPRRRIAAERFAWK